jgi:hypothetical protein
MEEVFWVKMNAKVMQVSVEVFGSEEVKNFVLVKPVGWQGEAVEQQHLFEHIVAQYLWRHVHQCLPANASLCEKLSLFKKNFAVDISSGWPLMLKAFLKCVSVFGVLEPAKVFEQKTIPELLKMQYYFFDMQWKRDERYAQVYELVDLVYKLADLDIKTLETLETLENLNL